MESSSEVQIISKLGEGAYGCVYKGCRTSDGMIVAIKVIKIADDEEGLPSTTLR
jgi:serine/threonine protein kinase